jgi:hypothetical protein
MAKRYREIRVATLAGSPISVRFDTDFEEYQVRVAGNKKASYHTTDKQDALATAQRMRNEMAFKAGLEINY